MCLEDVRKKIEVLMQNDICLLNLKVHGHYSALDECYRAIVYHQANIEKLKKGDFELCKELIEHEKEIEKQKQIQEQREASLSPEELKLYREGKLFISWRDDNDSVHEMYESLRKENEERKQELIRQESL